jgi:aspartate racemase
MRQAMKTIGIIGGMGPLATVHLFERIVLRTKAEKDQDHVHVLIDSNTNIQDRTKAILGHGKSPVQELISTAKILENSGADILIMPCNTAHHFINDIKKNISISIINMPEESVKYTYDKYGKDALVGIMATDGTIKTKIYENYYSELGIKTVVPIKTQTQIMKFIYDVIKKGNYDAGTDLFFECVNELKELGATVFLLGCTELSSAQYIYKFEGNFINPMEILAERAIIYAGGELN